MSTWELPEGLRQLLWLLGAVAAAGLLAALVLALLLWRRLRRLRLTPGAGFWQTLREVPLGLVVLLDLLDLSLDVFATPVVWWLLDRLRLRALRDVAAIEAFVPLTGPVPLMTLCWVLARLGVGGAGPPAREPGVLEAERVAPGKWRARGE